MDNSANSRNCLVAWRLLSTVLFGALACASAAAHDSLGPDMWTIDHGEVDSFAAGNTQLAASWVRKYRSGSWRCLSFKMTTVVPIANLEMVVISPDASLRYRDGDSSQSCEFCPAVKIDPTPRTGYYTVIVHPFHGVPTKAEFLLSVERRDSGSSACANPTPLF